MNRDKSFSNMHYIKETYPHWHKFATQIVGLPHEPIEHMWESVDYIRKNNLADLQIQPLLLEKMHGRANHNSDFVKNPEKYGITVLEERETADGVNLLYNYQHEHCDFDSAQRIAKQMFSKKTYSVPIDPWEKICEDALGNATPEEHIQSYIVLKKEQLLN